MTAVRAWLFALLATVLVLLPNAAPARSEHYCRMLGRVVSSCCCDEKATAAAPSARQQVQLEDCCRRISSANRSAAVHAEKGLRAVSPAALAAVAPDLAWVPPTAGVTRTRGAVPRTPLAIGPPLFVKHCALLS